MTLTTPPHPTPTCLPLQVMAAERDALRQQVELLCADVLPMQGKLGGAVDELLMAASNERQRLSQLVGVGGAPCV